MRVAFTIFSILLFGSGFSQAWLKLPDFPGSIRDDGVACVIGNKAYVGTGVDPGSATIDFKVFDFTNQQWSTIPNMPITTERQYACAFATDTALYVTCGLGANGALSSTYKYSLQHQSWKAMAPKPGRGLMSAVCFQFGNKIILAGGKGNNDTINHQVWQYDISNDTWSQKNNFPFSPKWRAAYCTVGTEGYLLGGIDSTSRFSKHLYRYDFQTDVWQLFDSMPLLRGRAYQAMQARGNNLVVFGGFDSLNTYYNDTYIYNTSTKGWDAAATLPAGPRKGGMSFSDGQNFYYTCGITSSGIRLNETWMTNMPLGVEENYTYTDRLIAYPNPSQEFLNLQFENDAPKVITLYDIAGNTVLENACSCGFQSIDVSNYNYGLYFLSVQYANGKTESKKILVKPNTQ